LDYGKAAQAKKEKDAAKKVLKRERKAFRTMCKANNYYIRGGEGEVVAGRLQELESLCDSLSVEQLQSLNERMSGGSVEEGQAAVEEALSAMRQREEAELAAQARVSQGGGAQGAEGVRDMTDKEWSREQVQLLVKAVTLHPAGTSKRWEVIATFINSHSAEGSKTKTPKQVINKVKALKKLESSQRESENSQAFQSFQQKHSSRATIEAAPTERYDKVLWTTDEQKLLENALRTYAASVPDRWDKIAAMVGTRSKTECVARCKELVARVKAKKQQS
jgi:DnaJ family protein C protein 2